MNGRNDIETGLRRHYRAIADDTPAPGALEAILERTAGIHPSPALVARAVTFGSPRLTAHRVRLALAVALLISLALLAFLVASADRTPHSGLLAFSRSGGIYLVGSDRLAPVAVLTPSADRGFSLPASAWSPDGHLLAIDQYRMGSQPLPDLPEQAVLTLDPLTGQSRDIADGFFLGWSGNDIVVGMSAGRAEVHDGRTGARRAIELRLGLMGAASLSPDGRWLVQAADQDLIRIDIATGERLTLFHNWGEMVDMPAWSPDSSFITIARTQHPGCHMCVGPLIKVRVDGAPPEILSPEGEVAWRSAWSPDGHWIAYRSTSGIVIERPDGSERRMIAVGQDPTWSPDSLHVRFRGAEALDEAMSIYHTYELDLTNGTMTQLDDGAGFDGYAVQTLPHGVAIPVLPSAGPR